MQDLKFDSTDIPGISEDWERCWESILRLPIEPFSADHLYDEAQRLVRACCSSAGDEGAEWFAWQVHDGQLFVAEQFASAPNDLDWQRIDAVLAGAQAGLISVPS